MHFCVKARAEGEQTTCDIYRTRPYWKRMSEGIHLSHPKVSLFVGPEGSLLPKYLYFELHLTARGQQYNTQVSSIVA